MDHLAVGCGTVKTDPVEKMLSELAEACEYSDGTDSEESGVDSLIAYKDALEDKLAQTATSLLMIMRNLYPEDHVGYWQTAEQTHFWLEDRDEEFLKDPDELQWDSGTIEWVASDLYDACRQIGLPLIEPYDPAEGKS